MEGVGGGESVIMVVFSYSDYTVFTKKLALYHQRRCSKAWRQLKCTEHDLHYMVSMGVVRKIPKQINNSTVLLRVFLSEKSYIMF
jgi:hypothetical protein